MPSAFECNINARSHLRYFAKQRQRGDIIPKPRWRLETMEKFAASRTALATSLMRAAHTRLDPHPLIDDPWGDRLVPESVKRFVTSAGESLDESLRRNASYANVIMRTRFAEDALQTAVAKGVSQYVLIGAGFDSFSLRRPACAAYLQS